MTRRRGAQGSAVMFALLLSGAAFAQAPSTGNPKGSIAPATEGSTANPPASPARTMAPGPSGSRPSGKAAPEDRKQQPQQPGTTTGAGTGDPSRRDQQDKAGVPMPPPRKPADDTKR